MSTRSRLPFTSVVSYHTTPMTCGVAKFSQLLADRLGVPMVPVSQPELWGAYPLLSLKWAELDPHLDHGFVRHQCCPRMEGSSAEVMRTAQPRTYGVFWHDQGDPYVTKHADAVYYADPSLGNPGLWCPSLLTPTKPRTVKLFSFGMATKLQPEQYRKVKALLDAAGLRYHLRVSVGIHEGTSLADAVGHFEALTDILGAENVTILGILSDDAVIEELQACDYVLAFFANGVQRNNTTVHAAHLYGRQVITNGEAFPAWNLDTLTAWPRVTLPYTWDNLLVEMERYATTHHR